MQLHSFAFSVKGKKKRRVGRGGKRGSYSGKGMKGQKARAGRKLRPAERELILHMPKRRGIGNPAAKGKAFPVTLRALQRFVGSGETITAEMLRKAKIVPRAHKGGIKVLDKGEISGALILRGLPASEGAKKKIEAAGGKVE